MQITKNYFWRCSKTLEAGVQEPVAMMVPLSLSFLCLMIPVCFQYYADVALIFGFAFQEFQESIRTGHGKLNYTLKKMLLPFFLRMGYYIPFFSF